MSKFKALWDLLNGKKTTIGALMMLASQVLGMLGMPEWGEVVVKLQEILMNGGMGLVAIGATHKAVK